MVHPSAPAARPLVIAVFDRPWTCDPQMAFDSASRQNVMNVYDCLVTRGAAGDIEPALALSWTVEEGPEPGTRTFGFRLRPDVRFHGGEVLGADDVVYSLRRALVTSRQLSAIWYDALSGGTDDPSLDDLAAACLRIRPAGDGVEITARSSFPALLSVLATWAPVLPRRWAVERGAWSGDLGDLARTAFPAETPLVAVTNGTGPYRLERWDRPDGVLVFRRHERYWGRGPEADEVRLVSEDDRIAREGMLLQARADFSVCQPESLSRIEAGAGITVEEVAEDWHLNPLGFITQRLDPTCPAVGSGRFDQHGLEPRALADLDLRLALSLSLDYDRLAREALGGRANLHHGPFPKPALRAGPTPSFRFDLDAAERHLASACGGLPSRDGCRIVAYTHHANVARVMAAQILADGFNQLRPRCRMDVVELPLSELSSELYAGRCPVAWLGWDADYPHAHALASQLLCPGALLPRSLGLDSPPLRALWRRYSQATDGESLEPLYAAMAEVAIGEVLYLFTPSKIGYLVYDSRWRGARLKAGVANVLDFASFALA